MLIHEDADIEEARKRQDQRNPEGAMIPGGAVRQLRPAGRAPLPGVRVYPQGKAEGFESTPGPAPTLPELAQGVGACTRPHGGLILSAGEAIQRVLADVPTTSSQRAVLKAAHDVLSAL